jgi:hypothetical protein
MYSGFPIYSEFEPQVPTWCVTPDVGRCIHRFHHSSPFSPSGRYLALTRLPFEDRRPLPGETAEVCLVDLEQGGCQMVATTAAWDTQLGAQVQWGAGDNELFFNHMDTETWMPYGVCLDPESGALRRLNGALYHVSGDGRLAVSTCLRRIGRTQAGYGVIVPDPPENRGAPANDGVYVTDTATGTCRMVVSYEQIAQTLGPALDVSDDADLYGFHVQFNPAGDRIMLVLREKLADRFRPRLITMTRDGDDIQVAVPASLWADRGGNHPIWCPDGEHLMMNLNLDGQGWRFVQVRYDGSDMRCLCELPAGHGHPSLHPDGRHMITDAYPTEAMAPGDGTAPLWGIDLEKNTQETLVRIDAVAAPFKQNMAAAHAMRVDLHPAWDRAFKRAAINGVINGTRHVFVADLEGWLTSDFKA